MRRLALALVIAGLWLLAPISAYSDTDLEALVNTAYFPRTTDAGLHAIAHERAVEIATDFSHDGRRDGTSEVLAYNQEGPERAVEQWQESPDHDAILSDPSYGSIGCGSYFDGTTSWYACVLAGEPVEVPTPTPAPSPDGGSLHDPCNDCSAGTPEPLPNTSTTAGGLERSNGSHTQR